MALSHQDFLKKFTPEERAAIAALSQEMTEGELTLRDLRQAQHLTQERMAALMGVAQENVSRLERRSDLLLSTLSSYVTAMGGKLRLIAEFPNRRPVAVTFGDLSDDAPPPEPRRRERSKPQPVVKRAALRVRKPAGR